MGQDRLLNQSIQFMTDNQNGFAPVGWKGTIIDGTWWRTGSFPGTAGMLKRQSDGIAWVVLINTSAWNGPEIYSYIDRMMTRTLAEINQWPADDLFDQSLPIPLTTAPTEFLIK